MKVKSGNAKPQLGSLRTHAELGLGAPRGSSHSSCPFNPLVANAFFRAGEIEAWGRGVQRIVDACKNAGTPKPKVSYDPSDLWMEFPFSPEYLKILSAPPESEQTSVKTPVETRVKTPAETRVKTPDLILAAFSENPNLTLSEVAVGIGKSISTVERASTRLVKSGKLKYVGPKKGGH
jgi:ATP-dependent DNA helicase RecG